MDGLFYLLLGVALFFLILVHSLLITFVIRYRRARHARAHYVTGDRRWELVWLGVPAVILLVLVVLSRQVMARIRSGGAPALVVEVLAEQYAWNFRYPGPDGKFGRIDPARMDASNPWGRVPDDPDGRDDIITINLLHLPVGEPAEFRLRAKDVVHSFFLPDLRFKQDAVPGMTMQFRLTPTAPGEYAVACAEFCGLGHYRMRGFLTVEPRADFEKWLKGQASE